MQIVLVGCLEELPREGMRPDRVPPTTAVVVGVDLVLRVAGGKDLPRIDGANRSAWYELLTRAALAVDDQSGAKDWAARADAAAWRSGSRRAVGFARLAAAQVALRRGDARAAVADALAAAGVFDRFGSPLDKGRAQLVANIAAADPMNSPAAGFGRTPRRLVDQLSQREQEVAGLVALGWTNRAIALDLFLSVKTVERHLTRIFVKVHITSRAALAAMVAREGG